MNKHAMILGLILAITNQTGLGMTENKDGKEAKQPDLSSSLIETLPEKFYQQLAAAFYKAYKTQIFNVLGNQTFIKPAMIEALKDDMEKCITACDQEKNISEYINPKRLPSGQDQTSFGWFVGFAIGGCIQTACAKAHNTTPDKLTQEQAKAWVKKNIARKDRRQLCIMHARKLAVVVLQLLSQHLQNTQSRQQ